MAVNLKNSHDQELLSHTIFACIQRGAFHGRAPCLLMMELSFGSCLFFWLTMLEHFPITIFCAIPLVINLEIGSY